MEIGKRNIGCVFVFICFEKYCHFILSGDTIIKEIMSAVTIDINRDSLIKLKEKAIRLNISPEELIRIVIEDLLQQPDEKFKQVVNYILKKNEDLYRRLA